MTDRCPRLIVETGPDAGRSFDIVADDPERLFVIGRAEGVDARLAADTFVSARHAAIVGDGTRHWLLDLGSKNGTVRRGARVPPHETAPLEHGDLLSIGRTLLRFVAADED